MPQDQCIDGSLHIGMWGHDGSCEGATGLRLFVMKNKSTWCIKWPSRGKWFGRFPSRKAARLCAEKVLPCLAGGPPPGDPSARRCAASFMEFVQEHEGITPHRLPEYCEEAHPTGLGFHPSIEDRLPREVLDAAEGRDTPSYLRGDLVTVRFDFTDAYGVLEWLERSRTTCYAASR